LRLRSDVAAPDRLAVVAEAETVDEGPLERAAADRGEEAELDEDDATVAAPSFDLAADVGQPHEDGTERAAHRIEAAHRRRERLDQLHVRREDRREAVERRRRPKTAEAVDEVSGGRHAPPRTTPGELKPVGSASANLGGGRVIRSGSAGHRPRVPTLGPTPPARSAQIPPR